MKQQQRPPTELVNSSTFLMSPGVNHPMKPPSNQNTSNNYDLLSCWRDQGKKSSDNVSSSNGVLFYNFLSPGPTRNEKRPSVMREPLVGGIDLDRKL
ncbi:hypothetical protein ZIOFF_059919 [Zingiber officinale]|uniref:Uncharacterized protein n=1 Tax=Zingiber officinale TaxID=94328 RepID=A0A8J5FA25_ZINOF|nr:hypothetical protein ZIOFF_059919 [Zingiber officinale]